MDGRVRLLHPAGRFDLETGPGWWSICLCISPVALCLRHLHLEGWTRVFLDRERVLLLSLTGLAMALEVAQSLNWVRVYCAAMPGIILFIWLMEQGTLKENYSGRNISISPLASTRGGVESNFYQAQAVAGGFFGSGGPRAFQFAMRFEL
jgi:hypothetical protein